MKAELTHLNWSGTFAEHLVFAAYYQVPRGISPNSFTTNTGQRYKGAGSQGDVCRSLTHGAIPELGRRGHCSASASALSENLYVSPTLVKSKSLCKNTYQKTGDPLVLFLCRYNWDFCQSYLLLHPTGNILVEWA